MRFRRFVSKNHITSRYSIYISLYKSNADIPVPVNVYTTYGYSPQKVIERMNYPLFAETETLDIEPSF